MAGSETMALFNWLGNKAISYRIEVLENSINQLRFGIFSNLLERYIPTLGMNGATMLSAALMNQIVAEEPANEEGANYLAKNQALIESEAAKLVNDKEVAEIAGLLYAAETMLVSISRNPNLARMDELLERANKLGFWIMNV
jgi:hypothetical protein